MLCDRCVRGAWGHKGASSGGTGVVEGTRLPSLGAEQARAEQGDCTYYPWEFGAVCVVVGKAAAVTSGDSVCLLETEAHGVHRLASAADHPLQRGGGDTLRWPLLSLTLRVRERLIPTSTTRPVHYTQKQAEELGRTRTQT